MISFIQSGEYSGKRRRISSCFSFSQATSSPSTGLGARLAGPGLSARLGLAARLGGPRLAALLGVPGLGSRLAPAVMTAVRRLV